MMKAVKFVTALLLLCFASGAEASTIETFDVTGTYTCVQFYPGETGCGGTFNDGTLIIDPTTNTVLGGGIPEVGLMFTTPSYPGAFQGYAGVGYYLLDVSPDLSGLFISFEYLAGFGSPCSYGHFPYCDNRPENLSGVLSNGVVTDTTPLPATLPLFATGIGGLGLLGWRRKRRA
jgi:hypothetical protein